MSHNIFIIIKLIASVIVVGVISIGLVLRAEGLVVLGAIIFVTIGIANLFQNYHEMKLFHGGVSKKEKTNDLPEHLSNWLWAAIWFFGLFLWLAAKDSESTGYSIAGGLIWISNVLLYLVAGLIVERVGKIPLRMGFGGWEIWRSRKGRKID